MKDRPIRKRTSPVPKTAINETNSSVYCYRGRIILKDLYLKLELIYDHEQEGDFQMPEEQFLSLIPYFENEGLTVVQEFITFNVDGILLQGCENVLAHDSREKLALFYLILSFECRKPIQMTLLLKGELLGLKKLSDLVDWISNYKSEKDMRRILENKASSNVIKSTPLPNIPNEKFLTATELATLLNVNPKTIYRNPSQFPSILMGKRKYYLYSEFIKQNERK